MKPRRLGRGLDFLLRSGTAEATAAAPAPSTAGSEAAPLHELAPEAIAANPWQPRTHFDDAGIAELADSLRRHGVLQPLVVRPRAGGGYELVAGERRLRAAKLAGLERVPVNVRAIDDDEMLVVALVENLQRRDLNPVERARGFQRLVAEHGLSHDDVAAAAGIGRSTVSNALRVLELASHHLEALEQGTLSEGHARALLAQPDPLARERLFEAIVAQRWNVRAAESAATSGAQRSRKRASPDAARLAERLRAKLGAKVTIAERGNRGRIVIEYRTLAEFERLFSQLAGESPDEP